MSKLFSKIILISSLLIGLSLLLSTSNSYAELTAVQQQAQDIQNQLTTLSNQAKQRQFQRLKSTLISAAKGETPNLQKLESAQNMSQLESSGSTPTCNCYSSSTQNSDPNNFIYNANGQRINRISPYCKCQPSSTTSNAQENVTNPGSSSSNLKINY